MSEIKVSLILGRINCVKNSVYLKKNVFDLKLLKGTVTDTNFASDINCKDELKKSRSRFVFMERLASIHVLKARPKLRGLSFSK